ncbi:MAG: signal peptidase I [Oscillospiraceae bacterium]|nr:signal peptidase I [Oscillospiraceae bacterium]
MKKALSIIANVFAWIILIFAFLMTLIVFSSGRNNGVANLLGYIPLTVESDSMKPTFSKDDMIICKEIDDVYALKEGDVITFWTVIEGARVKNTHRIVTVENADGALSFVTRGDNNLKDDDTPVYAGDLIGKWTGTKLGGLGKAMNFLRTKTGFFICILIPMALFFLIELYKFIATLIEAKRGDVPEIDEEEIKRRAIEEYLASQKQAEAEKQAAEKQADAAADAGEKGAEALAEAAEKAADAAAEVSEKAAGAAAEATEQAAETAEKTVDDVVEAAKEI